ncbi:hypothetical protein [Flammeovirga sp. SJP92]|uniref:hypothetical protein n=1 Tax=Flammeovirga sp. SJP92 TaxID=1775430 RepID=UPI0007876632|nr:hypothetical protein [Flammeovirga sp. SJP92]KXX70927.1 hypothetical protein AVL50_11185 [Flammeovirga sp. SJP92]
MEGYSFRFYDTLGERRLSIPKSGDTHFWVKGDSFYLEDKYNFHKILRWRFEKKGDSLIFMD